MPSLGRYSLANEALRGQTDTQNPDPPPQGGPSDSRHPLSRHSSRNLPDSCQTRLASWILNLKQNHHIQLNAACLFDQCLRRVLPRINISSLNQLFCGRARSDEWRVIGAFHKPKTALISSSSPILTLTLLVSYSQPQKKYFLMLWHSYLLTASSQYISIIIWRKTSPASIYHQNLMEKIGHTNEVGNTSKLITTIWMGWRMAPSTAPYLHYQGYAYSTIKKHLTLWPQTFRLYSLFLLGSPCSCCCTIMMNKG